MASMMKRLLLLIVPILAGGCAMAQTLPQATVLDSGLVYKTASFPSCHAATLCQTADSSLLVAFFAGKYEGASDVSIWTSRLIRGSRYWTPPRKVASRFDPNGKQIPCWNPVLYRVPGKRDQVLLYYKTGTTIPKWMGHVLRSKDGGRTWKDYMPLMKGQLGAIKNKPVCIGRKLVAPSSIEPDWQPRFEIGSKDGRVWRVITVPRDTTIKAIQPAILTLPKDTLLALCRTKNGFLAETYSTDRGESWSAMRLTDIPNNNSGIDAITLSSGIHAMVYTPLGLTPGSEFGPRTPLVLALSADGRHWTQVLTLEDQEGEYSYPTIIEGCDHTLHIVYTYHRTHIKYAHIRLAQ